jgi:hypothetical protein
VAELFHSVCLLGMANTRIEDDFDHWVLLTEGGLDTAERRRAIEATFSRWQLAIPDTIPLGLSDAFAQAGVKQAQGVAFLKENRLQPLDLIQMVGLLRKAFQTL